MAFLKSAVFILFVLALCVLEPVAYAASVRPSCEALPGFEKTAGAKVIVMGDLHGTVEPPAIFERAACIFSAELGAQHGVIALELPDSFNSYFADIRPASLDAARHQTDSDAFWNEFRDGRHSADMLALVHDLMALTARSEGHLKLIAIERQPIDQIGAAFFVESMKSFHADRGLVFIGNAHARMLPMPGMSVVPFAKSVDNAGYHVVSLDVHAGSGMGWRCTSRCEAIPWFPLPETGGVKVVINASAEPQAWHGYYYIPSLNLSHSVYPNSGGP